MNQTKISQIANSDFQTFKKFVMQPTPEFETIKSFKEELKVFYNTYIEPKLFEYELLK